MRKRDLFEISITTAVKATTINMAMMFVPVLDSWPIAEPGFYGELSESQLRKYMARQTPLLRYHGLMSFYPVVNDELF